MRKQLEGIYPLTVALTKKEAIMRKVKLIVHETYQGNRKSEDVFAAVFLSNAAALTPMRCESPVALYQQLC